MDNGSRRCSRDRCDDCGIMSDRTKLRLVYAAQIVLACALMLFWFWWAPGGRAGKNQAGPWPACKKGGWSDNFPEMAVMAGLLLGCFWTEWLKTRIARRMRQR